MLKCPNPTCKEKLPGLHKTCPRCKSDLSLLVDYVESLQDGLAQADALTRTGDLGDAVWKYLEVLEVDPDNATARRQVGKVATAVRQFDQASPSRGMWRKLRRQGRFRRWWASFVGEGEDPGWVAMATWSLALVCVFVLGYLFGVYQTRLNSPPATTASAAAP